MQDLQVLKEFDYEKQVEINRKRNIKYLDLFEKHLQEKGLTDKTIRNHYSNVEFYLNDFLCYYDIQPMEEGCDCISEFLGNWFIRKTTWASCATIKSTASSIKKFYQYMLELDEIDTNDYKTLCVSIKDNLEGWLEGLRRWDSEDDYFLD